MTHLEKNVVAERAMAVERHLLRVERMLPPTPGALRPASDASDAVVLHLWQATQIILDLASALCAHLDLGAPANYGDSFRRLEKANVIDGDLANSLVRASGFRNVVAHAYDDLDMRRVYIAATEGPRDLRRFIAATRDALAQ